MKYDFRVHAYEKLRSDILFEMKHCPLDMSDLNAFILSKERVRMKYEFMLDKLDTMSLAEVKQ